MKKLIVFIAIAAMLVGCSEKLPIDKQYPGPWIDDYDMGIAKTLTKKGIRGCGEFKYRPNSQHSNEYLVYCTRDGNKFVAYLVWPLIDEVIGPMDTDPSLK